MRFAPATISGTPILYFITEKHMATTNKKKVVIPIDERETFVSIQKSFADSEENVKEKLITLYELQKTDNAIEELVQLRGELPGEVKAIENELDALKARRAHFEQVIDEYNNSVENYKQHIVELDADIAKYQKQLENISNSREYDSINKELENLGLLRQIADKNIYEAHDAVAAKKEDIAAIDARIAVREADFAAKREELDTIVESTSKEEAVLVERRSALTAKVDARTLSAYDLIRGSVHNHLAVVPVINSDSCGGCFNTITPQRLIEIASGRKLIICEHCGRIIVNPDLQ